MKRETDGLLATGQRAVDYDYNGGESAWGGSGTSIFDPVLCELAYRWFCPDGGRVLDPFAGGSVRGIVCSVLDREYHGIDLSERQITANKEQGEKICKVNLPQWYNGNSLDVKQIVSGEFDFVFSCPPYYNLEVYSEEHGDLSNKSSYPEFIESYRKIIAECCSLLKTDRFACFVVGDIRDKQGIYRNFVSDTIAAFQDCGAMLYNEAILITAAGSLPIRCGKVFQSSRKLGKTHQNVLVFYKGNVKNIKANFPEIEINLDVFEDV